MLLLLLLPEMGSVRKHPKSKFWYACFTDSNGVRTTRSTKTKNCTTALKITVEWEKAATQASEDGSPTHRPAPSSTRSWSTPGRTPSPSTKSGTGSRSGSTRRRNPARTPHTRSTSRWFYPASLPRAPARARTALRCTPPCQWPWHRASKTRQAV
jgi:hypothetical protein